MADLHLLTKAIYEALIGASAVTADLPVYRGAPAVFSGFIVPPDAPLPRVVIGDVHSDPDPAGDTTVLGRDQHRDIFVYASRGKTIASENPIDRIAENVRLALHNNYLTVAGWYCILAFANGPVAAPTDETLMGRVLTVRYRFSAQ